MALPTVSTTLTPDLLALCEIQLLDHDRAYRSKATRLREWPVSRACVLLQSAQSCEPWAYALGIFAAEGGYVVNEDGTTTAHRLLTLVLNFDLMSRQWHLLSALAGSARFIVERPQVVPLVEAPSRLIQFLAPYEGVTANVVVVLPEVGSIDLQDIEQVLAELRRASILTIENLVGLANQPYQWAELQQVGQFVEFGPSGRSWATVSVYRILAALMAPEALAEVDAHDIAHFLGTAYQPSFVVQLEMCPETGAIGYVSDFASSSEQPIAAALVTSLMGEVKISFPGQLLRQWSALQATDAEVTISVTTDFFELSWRASDVPMRLVALCRCKGKSTAA